MGAGAKDAGRILSGQKAILRHLRERGVPIHRSTLGTLVEEHAFPAVKVPVFGWCARVEIVDEWLEEYITPVSGDGEDGLPEA